LLNGEGRKKKSQVGEKEKRSGSDKMRGKVYTLRKRKKYGGRRRKREEGKGAHAGPKG